MSEELDTPSLADVADKKADEAKIYLKIAQAIKLKQWCVEQAVQSHHMSDPLSLAKSFFDFITIP
jgi:hypothetical protein